MNTIRLHADPAIEKFANLSLDKRPAEKLYNLKNDPGELKNIADDKKYSSAKKKLRAALDNWMQSTGDPRANPETDNDAFDRYPYYGAKADSAPPQLKK